MSGVQQGHRQALWPYPITLCVLYGEVQTTVEDHQEKEDSSPRYNNVNKGKGDDIEDRFRMHQEQSPVEEKETEPGKSNGKNIGNPKDIPELQRRQ